MTELFHASREFSTRPSDERFASLHTMGAMMRHQREIAREATLASKAIEFVHVDDGKGDVGTIKMQRKGNTDPAKQSDPTHWSFGQLATLAGAPAGYLRTLHPALSSDCLNFGLQVQRKVEDVKMLWHCNGTNKISAATGPQYGRVWNTDIVDTLIRNFGDGVTGDWRVPGMFGKPLDDVTKANTTLFASDRDMFVFLADENHKIEVRGRRNNETGEMSRGFFVWNSEVGGGTLGIASFLFDYVCCNRIVWGTKDVKFVKIRHTASAPTRFLDDVRPLLNQYANGSPKPVEETIKAAQAKRVSDDVADFLAKRRYNASQVTGILNAHIAEEGRPVETVWDTVTAITAFARKITYQNERVAMERDAGKLLDMVAV